MDQVRIFLENKRVIYMSNRVLSSFKLNHDKWETMLKDDEKSRHAISVFIVDNKCRHIFYYLTSKNALSASNNLLSSLIFNLLIKVSVPG